jgi:hypothetical protein
VNNEAANAASEDVGKFGGTGAGYRPGQPGGHAMGTDFQNLNPGNPDRRRNVLLAAMYANGYAVATDYLVTPFNLQLPLLPARRLGSVVSVIDSIQPREAPLVRERCTGKASAALVTTGG